MRFYNLQITGATGSQSNFQITSLTNGKFNPGALNIEVDAEVWYQQSPTNASVIIWGVPLAPSFGLPGINQASDLNNSQVKLYAGMSSGLPLAHPEQQGLILQGTVFQAFGNWIGTAMTINLIVTTDGSASQSSPLDPTIALTWKKGTQLSVAIQQALQKAYPSGWTFQINISKNLIAVRDTGGCWSTLTAMSQNIYAHSKSIIKDPNYPGVTIIPQPNNVIVVTDNSASTTSSKNSGKNLNFSDLIGQPTWIGPNAVQFNTVLRGDISIGDTITFPNLQATSTAAELSQQAQDRSAFQGPFIINYSRHVGNFRQPSAESWITTFNASPAQSTLGT